MLLDFSGRSRRGELNCLQGLIMVERLDMLNGELYPLRQDSPKEFNLV